MPKLIVIGLDDESKEMDLLNTNEKEINKFLIDSIKKKAIELSQFVDQN